MTDFYTILQNKKQAEDLSAKVQRDIVSLQERIKKGEESLGDPIKDFIIVHYPLEAEQMEPKLREIHGKVSDIAGKDVLIANEMLWWTSTGRSGCFDSGMRDHQLKLYRFGVSGEPQWDIDQGLVLPMERHACLITSYNHDVKEWEPKPSPIILGVSELQYDVPHRSITDVGRHEDRRKDLPNLWDHYSRLGFNVAGISEVSGTMGIFTGKDIEKTLSNRMERLRFEGKKMVEADLYTEAKQCVREGLNRTEYTKKLAREKEERKLYVAEQLYSGNYDLLQEALNLGLHKSGMTLTKPLGVEVHVDKMVKQICHMEKLPYE